ncbi:hypothetical protein [Limnobacter parvus]|uniref:Uncharacterized protein n=1 Tax=Limnobacter parvus TaxID=2939690 RepID=A0ABT1XFA6_9BURK|nr:hypothetical protein [Limnobacter parvus]MCR2745278.1 hypothetical protein [Limnobacter parvus]
MIKFFLATGQTIDQTLTRAVRLIFSFSGARCLMLASSIFFSVGLIGLSSGFMELLKLQLELMKEVQTLSGPSFEELSVVSCATIEQALVSTCKGLKARADLLDSAAQLAEMIVIYAFLLGFLVALAALAAFLRGAYSAKETNERFEKD